MKKTLLTLTIPFFLLSCGGQSSKSNEEKAQETQIISDEETAVIDNISKEVKSDIQEVKEVTEENLEEIDSLLENF